MSNAVFGKKLLFAGQDAAGELVVLEQGREVGAGHPSRNVGVGVRNDALFHPEQSMLGQTAAFAKGSASDSPEQEADVWIGDTVEFQKISQEGTVVRFFVDMS